MEKSPTSYSAQEIKRKPLAPPAPPATQTHSLPKKIATTTESDSKPEYETHRHPTISTIETLPPRTQHAQRSFTFTSRIRTHYSHLSKPQRITILTLLTLLLILLITLAAYFGTHHSPSNLPLPSSHGGPYTGDLTYYDPALGACGWTNSGSDSICAVSHIIFDAVSTSANPNSNPLCGKKIRIRVGERSEDLTVVDRCTGCKSVDIDTTRGVFGSVADIDEGRVGVQWAWLEDVPGEAAGG